MESILTSIKKLLGIPEDYTAFDDQIIIHINSVFMILNQLGVGPKDGFTKREYILACNALDRGNDIVIHRNALKYKYARRLVVEGAIVTDSFSDLLIRCGKTPNGYLYFDKDKNPLFLKI